MPREVIRFGLRDLVTELKRTHNYNGVRVPKFAKTKKCAWTCCPKLRQTRQGGHKVYPEADGKHNTIDLPFEVLLDIMDFALDHAIVKMPDGSLLRQAEGIPMGDPLSPGMTIGACAWMEKEWMANLHDADKRYFRVKRYMDDIILKYAKHDQWDHAQFCKDFQESTCYVPPLKLEEGRQDTFLETRMNTRTGEYWLKNDNEDGVTRVWRYQHFWSHTSYEQKRAVLTSCLLKVHQMASNKSVLRTSAAAKLREFARLRYPRHMLKAACTYIAASRGERTWLDVRDEDC